LTLDKGQRLEQKIDDLRGAFDALRNWIMASLLAALLAILAVMGQLAVQLVAHKL